MRIALSVFEGRVSSVFDWAGHLVVYVVDPDARSPTRIAKIEMEMEMDDLTPEGRGRRLAELGVDTLLCGGISAPLASLVEAQGVKVIAGVVGEADAVLDAFIAGRLADPRFAMPGWRCPGQGTRGRRGCGRRRGPGGGRGQGNRQGKGRDQ